MRVILARQLTGFIEHGLALFCQRSQRPSAVFDDGFLHGNLAQQRFRLPCRLVLIVDRVDHHRGFRDESGDKLRDKARARSDLALRQQGGGEVR